MDFGDSRLLAVYRRSSGGIEPQCRSGEDPCPIIGCRASCLVEVILQQALHAADPDRSHERDALYERRNRPSWWLRAAVPLAT